MSSLAILLLIYGIPLALVFALALALGMCGRGSKW